MVENNKKDINRVFVAFAFDRARQFVLRESVGHR